MCLLRQTLMLVGCFFGLCCPSLKPCTRRGFLGSHGWVEREVTASCINEQRGRWLSCPWKSSLLPPTQLPSQWQWLTSTFSLTSFSANQKHTQLTWLSELAPNSICVDPEWSLFISSHRIHCTYMVGGYAYHHSVPETHTLHMYTICAKMMSARGFAHYGANHGMECIQKTTT